MKYFSQLFLATVVSIIVSGCAANQALYEEPLHDYGLLTEQSGQKGQLEEITYDKLENMEPAQRPPLDSDEAGLWMVMDQAEEKLKTAGNLVRDKQLRDYVESVACKLGPEYCGDFRIYVVRAPSFNATMAPNGAMQVWTGLLLRLQNEAQLAAIIGHEMGHYLRRHSLQRMRDIIDKTNAGAFLQFASYVAGVGVVGDAAQLAIIGSIQAYSRDHEREADGYGLALMSRAGYDPREATKVWFNLIEEAEADDDQHRVPVFLSTHPAPKERQEALKELGERIVAKGGLYKLGKDRFSAMVLPFRAEYLRDELHQREFARTEKFFDMLLERGDDPGEVHFFKGELFRLRGEEGDIEKALVEYEKAAQMNSAVPEMYRAMGLLYSKKGKHREAIKAFNEYLVYCAECSDREMVMHMIKGMGK